MASRLWKHEEPLELESKLETNIEAESPLSIFGIPLKAAAAKTETAEERCREATDCGATSRTGA